MRIIAGKFKRGKLIPVPGNTARPTTDFMRETLFNTLESCEGKRFLDLYAGSGAVGLEAISRGAEEAVFIEFSINSLRTIQKNVEHLKCEQKSRILRRNALAYIKKADESFDYIFMDPPYNKDLIAKTLNALLESKLLENGPVIIVERSAKEKIPEAWQSRIIAEKETRHKTITFLK